MPATAAGGQECFACMHLLGCFMSDAPMHTCLLLLLLLLQDGHVIQFANASAAHMALGVFILWLGWWVLMALGFTLACFAGFSPATGCNMRSNPPASPTLAGMASMQDPRSASTAACMWRLPLP